MADKITHQLLQNGDSAQKYMQGSKARKIKNSILLDNFVQKRRLLTSTRNNALQQHSKRSRRCMSMKKLKKNGLYNLPQQFHKFDTFLPMHDMWKSFVLRLLKAKGKNQVSQCILSADLHGVYISVAECKVASFTGVNGIMIRETAETFGIVTQKINSELYPRSFLCLYLDLIAGKLRFTGTNSPPEIPVCCVDVARRAASTLVLIRSFCRGERICSC